MSDTPDVHAIVEEHLRANGFDGLFNTCAECACEASDLAPCGQFGADCQPGVRVGCTCGEECAFHIVPKRATPERPDSIPPVPTNPSEP